MDLAHLFDLQSHGPDTFVGTGPRYPWGGLYGGQIVAQGLRAAAATVDASMSPHSLRAYFIRRGDHTEPIRFEVDRIRNGRSFCTRRVVARQAVGAILNLEASFQAFEPAADVSPIPFASSLPRPDDLDDSSWSDSFHRRWVPATALHDAGVPARSGSGRTAAWMRVRSQLADDELLHRCWLAYLSDDLPTDAVVRAHPMSTEGTDSEHPQGVDDDVFDNVFAASLDHTVWFHRPFRADQWHLQEFTCHSFTGGRGLALGHVFALDPTTDAGVHVATVAQEVLMRDVRARETGDHG